MKDTEVTEMTTSRSPPVRVAVEFVIYSDTLSSDEVSNRLGIQATGSAAKGVKLGKRTRTPITIPRHMWQLSSEAHVGASDLGSHLTWVLAKLSPLQEQLREIRTVGSAEFRLVGRVWTSGTSVHVQLSKPVLNALVTLDLELQLEFADYGQDE